MKASLFSCLSMARKGVFFMKIGFIGAGKVGTAFGSYLKQKGFQVAGYYSRTFSSAQNAAAASDSRAFDSLSRLSEACDLLFITTGDDDVSSVAAQLAQSPCLRRGQLIVHMSGALPSTVLNPVKARGCSVYSLHPLQSFADIQKSVQDLSATYFSLEGDGEHIEILENMLKDCGNRYFILKADQKTLYHAAACILSNYLVTLVHKGLQLMEGIEPDGRVAFEAMLPLIEGTLKNISMLGTKAALTGPIARQDIHTVAKQLEAVQTAAPEQLALFAALAAETAKLAGYCQNDKGPSLQLEQLIKSYL
jgi:predicted short-subunit dehydrogenase-like oxidoreductase (DUF2520 family)